MPNTTEQIILEKAREVFVKKGFAGARMQEIADAAGINKAMLHYYFRSKEQLFKVIVAEIMQDLIPKLGDALAGGESVVAKLEQVIRLYISFLRENPFVPIFVLHELSQNRVAFIKAVKEKAARFPNFPAFFEQVIKEQSEGKIRPIHPVHLLLNVMGMVVFPFVARPMVTNLVDIPEAQFDAMMEDRAEVVIGFVRRALAVEK